MTPTPAAADRESRGPLEHIVVIDLTQHLAGPFATQMLGDLGARVVKVEPPGGDPTRSVGPHFVDGDGAYYMSVNRNKESICIDLKSAEGRQALLALVRGADAVVENFRPGKLEALGVGAQVLQEVRPDLVVCSLSGFGQDGPYRDRPAFDMIVQALGGGMSLTGEIGGRPVRSGLPIGDLCAGMNAATAVLAGLLRTARDGRGARIDVAMLDTQVSLLSYVAAYCLAGGEVPGLQGRQHMSIPTYRSFTCGDDRDIVVTANTPRMWRGLCLALGTTGLLDDPRFTTNEDRRRHAAELAVELESAAAAVDSADLLARLDQQSVPSARINSVADALGDPHVRSRGMVLEQTRGRDISYTVGDPMKIDRARGSSVVAPRRGADTDVVLREVAGLDGRAIEALRASGAVGPTPSPGPAGRAGELVPPWRPT